MAAHIPENDLFDPEKGRDEIITVFDGLMNAVEKHIKQEYDAQRIRGTDYANVYMSAMQATLGNSVQYLLGMALNNEQRDKLIADRIGTDAQTDQIEYVTDVQLPAQVRQTDYQTDNVLPTNVNLTRTQRDLVLEQITELDYKNTNFLPAQRDALTLGNIKLDSETRLVNEQISEISYRIANMLPKEALILERQSQKLSDESLLIQNKVVSEQKQPTLIDTQINLYNRQREAYDDDYNIKIYKAGTDVYSVVKTVTETAFVPESYARPESYWPAVLPKK